MDNFQKEVQELAARMTFKEEAQRIIAAQAASRPANGNIGPGGAWERAASVQHVGKRRVYEYIEGPSGFPSQELARRAVPQRLRRVV